jgi:hypothetical protein
MDTVNRKLEIKRKNPLEKLEALKKAHDGSQTRKTNMNFYPIVVNNSTIKFSTQEVTLLEKGLK